MYVSVRHVDEGQLLAAQLANRQAYWVVCTLYECSGMIGLYKVKVSDNVGPFFCLNDIMKVIIYPSRV